MVSGRYMLEYIAVMTLAVLTTTFVISFKNPTGFSGVVLQPGQRMDMNLKLNSITHVNIWSNQTGNVHAVLLGDTIDIDEVEERVKMTTSICRPLCLFYRRVPGNYVLHLTNTGKTPTLLDLITMTNTYLVQSLYIVIPTVFWVILVRVLCA